MWAWAAAMPARSGDCSTSPTRGEIERHLVRRHVLKVEYDPDRPGERGMFFGAAGVYDGIHLCTGSIHTRGLTGSWASTSTILAILGRALWRGVEATGIGGDEIGASVDGGPWTNGRRALVLATTLDRLVLGTRPFWNNGGEPIHYTMFDHPPTGIVGHARQILFGGKQRESARPAVPQPVGRPRRAAPRPAVHHRRRVLPGGAGRPGGDHGRRGSPLRQAPVVSGPDLAALRAIVAVELASPADPAVAAVAEAARAAHGPASARSCSTAAAAATVTARGFWSIST